MTTAAPRAVAVVAGAILAAAFFLYPMMTYPLGDRFERAAERFVERGGCAGIQLIVPGANLAALSKVVVTTDGAAVPWRSESVGRDFDRILVELRFNRTVPRGATIRVNAPFEVVSRPIYLPSVTERVTLLVARMITWVPVPLAAAGALCVLLFSATGLWLVAAFDDPGPNGGF